MKNLIRNSLIFLLFGFFFATNLYGYYDPATGTYVGETSSRLDDSQKRIFNAKLLKDGEEVGDVDQTKSAKVKEQHAGKVLEEEKYFIEYTAANCGELSDYTCPNLTSEKQMRGYRTRINSIDLKNGRISCSVLKPVRSTQLLTAETETPIYTEVFTQKACVEKYSTAINKDVTEEVEKLKLKFEEHIADLKQQEFKYTVDYKNNGEDKFLDLADVLDGTVTFNGTELFDIEQTLLTRNLTTKVGYTTEPNDIIIEKFNQNLKSFSQIIQGNGWSSDRFFEQVEVESRVRDVAGVVANTNLLMLWDFFTAANSLIIEIVSGVAFVFVFYNLAMGWVVPAITNKISKNHDNEDHVGRAFFGFLMLVFVVTGDIQEFNIENQNASTGEIRQKLEVEQTKIQSAVQVLISETNDYADKFARLGIEKYLKSLNGSTGLLDNDQINALASERMILTKESEQLALIDKDMCASNYNINAIIDRLKEYRARTLTEKDKKYDVYGNRNGFFADNSSEVNSLRANPYPKSEREANAMMIQPGNYSSGNNVSPYNQAYQNQDAGFVEQINSSKFTAAGASPLSLSGCYYNKKKMISNDARLREIEKEFTKLGDDGIRQAKIEYLRVINELQWSLYAKQGYLSVMYLPLMQLLVDSLGVVSDVEEQMKALEQNVEDDENAIVSFIAENVTFLAFLGGHDLAKTIHVIKGKLADFGGGVFEFFMPGVAGNFASKIINNPLTKLVGGGNSDDSQITPDLIDYTIAIMIIRNSLETMVLVTLMLGSLCVFLVNFIEKLFAFISTLFWIIWTFNARAEERLISSFSKLIAIAAKTILIVVCAILTMFMISLIDTFQHIMVNSFFSVMDTMENASWDYLLKTGTENLNNLGDIFSLFFQKYILQSVSMVVLIFVKLLLVFHGLYRLPNFLYELIYERVNSVSEDVVNTAMSATEANTMRV